MLLDVTKMDSNGEVKGWYPNLPGPKLLDLISNEKDPKVVFMVKQQND